MSAAAGARREFGEGPLARVAALVHTLLVVELMFVAVTVPGLVVLMLLDRDASNIPLFALCFVPVGPAVSAAVYALHRRSADLTDLHPAAAFRRGYRLNLRPALSVWLPALAVLGVVAVSLTHRAATGVPVWWSALLAALAVALVLWTVNALVITSLFVFRTADVARLAVYFLIRRPAVALGNAGLVLAAAAATVLVSEALAMLLASVLAGGLLAVARPMITEIEERFVA